MNATIHSTEALLAQVSWLNALALELVQDRGEAEDLAQETILRALEHPPRAAGAMRGFLRRVSRNIQLDRARADSRRRDREELAAREEAVSPTDDVVDRLATHRRLVDAIEQLAEPYRATILLRYFDGLAPREIAQAQNAPVKTVNTRLQRAIEQLREELDERANGDRRQWALMLLPFVERSESVPTTSGLAKSLVVATAAFAVIVAGVFGWRSVRSESPRTPADAIAATVNQLKSAADALEEPRDTLAREPATGTVERATAGKLIGRVAGADGRPIERASVAVFLRAAADFEDRTDEFTRSATRITEVATDAAGRFEIGVPSDSSYRVVARAAGYGTEIQDDALPGEDVVFELRRAARIELSVIADEDETPCAGAQLSIMRTGVRGSIFEGLADSGGRSTVGDLAPGIYIVGATPRDAERVFTIDLVLHEGESVAHVLRAQRGGVVEGCVRSAADGRPIAGARVRQLNREVVADAGGCFEMRGLSWSQARVHFTVEAEGFARLSFVRDARARDHAELELEPEARVSGTLVGAHGEPIAGAWIILDGRESRTQGDGTFSVGGLVPGSTPGLLIRAAGHATVSALAPAELARGDNALGRIELAASASISGRVCTKDGQPIAGATVSVNARGPIAPLAGSQRLLEDVVLDDETTFVETTVTIQAPSAARELPVPRPSSVEPPPLRDRAVRTSASGRFRMFDLPAGKYQLAARARGRAATAPIDIEIAAGEERGDVVIAVADGSTIGGTVRGTDDVPIANAWIVLIDAAGQGLNQRIGVNGLSAIDGSFVLDGVPAGSYSIEASFHGLMAGRTYGQVTVNDVVPPVHELDIRLPLIAFIEGTLVDDASRPIADRYVRATDETGHNVSGETDVRGRFRIGVVEGRTVTLSVQDPVIRSAEEAAAVKSAPKWKGELAGITAGTIGVVLRASLEP